MRIIAASIILIGALKLTDIGSVLATTRSTNPRCSVAGQIKRHLSRHQQEPSKLFIDSISGNYESKPIEGSEDSCEISAHIFRVSNSYHYRLTVSDKIYNGILKVMPGQASDEKSIVFTGIKWALNEGDLTHLKEGEDPVQLKLPVGVSGILKNKEILLQNYGNAMNHYIQLAGCEQKFIRMVKTSSN